MTRFVSTSGFVVYELLAAIVALTLFGALVVGSISGMRQLNRVEDASARLEEAQNIMARWRRGETLQLQNWTMEVIPVSNHCEQLVLKAPGLHLATLRAVP